LWPPCMSARSTRRSANWSAPHFEAILGDLLGRLRSSPDARVRHELKHVVRSCPIRTSSIPGPGSCYAGSSR
jgi:hypothetical protein